MRYVRLGSGFFAFGSESYRNDEVPTSDYKQSLALAFAAGRMPLRSALEYHSWLRCYEGDASFVVLAKPAEDTDACQFFGGMFIKVRLVKTVTQPFF